MQRCIAALLCFSFIILCTRLTAKQKFSVSSPSFENNGILPAEYAGTEMPNGKNIPPEIQWKNPPENTKSFALTCIDITPIANDWVHWMVFNIPANATHFPEKVTENNIKIHAQCHEALNTFGWKGYGGPQPPENTGCHTYVFTVYALNIPYIHPNKRKPSYKYFLKMLRNNIIAKATISCYYKYTP